MLDTAETVVRGGSDWMDWSSGKTNLEACLVRTLGCRPSVLGKINVSISIVYTV